MDETTRFSRSIVLLNLQVCFFLGHGFSRADKANWKCMGFSPCHDEFATDASLFPQPVQTN
jgi:hypothetical protein